ncbi:MAG: hypothetical protein EOP45_09275 [Sphingobacteriaceae bacterium]|nr:MAG: hypothetical protein EOP45_09275 [Sphingobacteriaceae bacterium]
MFDEVSRFPPDIKSLPREHKKCVISEFAGGGLDKNALMNARFTNTQYWLENQSQCQVSSVVMANADLVFFRQVPERQLQWIWRNYLSCNVVKFETLKEHMTKTDTVPYMYTVLAFRNCEVQFYSYVAPRQLALDDVKDKRLGSEEFWRELTALETNKYFEYPGEPRRIQNDVRR